MAEEAITVIGGAGGFHFLPAGSPRVDPSRLLHGDRLSKLLAGARESFDIVIVNAPPVLPVPDALTIGRWVDGAVLAVRFDTSRYPLVERANRRLAARRRAGHRRRHQRGPGRRRAPITARTTRPTARSGRAARSTSESARPSRAPGLRCTSVSARSPGIWVKCEVFPHVRPDRL